MALDGALDVTVESESVAFTFSVTNAGSDPVEVTFPSGKVADVSVSAGDVEVWRWSDGRMFTQAVETETLAPDESLEHEVTWADPDPGTYDATASLAATGASVTDRATFAVR